MSSMAVIRLSQLSYGQTLNINLVSSPLAQIRGDFLLLCDPSRPWFLSHQLASGVDLLLWHSHTLCTSTHHEQTKEGPVRSVIAGCSLDDLTPFASLCLLY